MTRRRRKPLLTDKQWAQIEPLLPPLPKSKQGGQPWTANRPCLEGILSILPTGARWQVIKQYAGRRVVGVRQ